MDFQVGKYYILGPKDEYLDGPFDTYDSVLNVWGFSYPRSARIKQWTARGWEIAIARWVKGAWQGS